MKVVFIRVNLIVHPTHRISVIHTALDSIPHEENTKGLYGSYITFSLLAQQQLYSSTGWWFINIHVHTYFTERIWQVTCLCLSSDCIANTQGLVNTYCIRADM